MNNLLRRAGRPVLGTSMALLGGAGALITGSALAYAVGPAIATIAGDGHNGYMGDGGLAITAQLHLSQAENRPSFSVTDATGTLFIADTKNNVIRKVVDPIVNGSDVISTFAGTGRNGYSGDGGPSNAAELNQPTGVAVDGQGDLFVADTGNNVVRKILAGGVIETIAGAGMPGFSGDGGPATAARLNQPTGLALDSSGDLFIADTGNNVVREVLPNGVIQTVAGKAHGGPPPASPDGTPDGPAGIARGDGGPATSGHLNHPTGLALNAGGWLYIADTGDHYVRVVSPAGTITAFAGEAGKDAGGGGANNGNGGLATSARLSEPTGVSVDSLGNVLIADVRTNVVREVDPSGVINTYAGDGHPGYTGDGNPALAAQLRHPTGVEATPAAVYVTDSGNSVERGVFIGPPPVLPESLSALLLPLGAAALFGVGAIVMTRQNRRRAVT